METHKGWHSRGYLPHCDSAHAIQHVVFRLADALPATVLAALETAPTEERMDAAEATLDIGVGSRALGDPRAAKIVEDALLHFDGRRYRLLAWCVMPTHVHALIAQTEGWGLSSILQSWKSFTAKAVAGPIDRRGRFWAPDYFDRYMRDDGQLHATLAYIQNNPVKAGLCQEPQNWIWSSAHRRSADVPRERGPPARR